MLGRRQFIHHCALSGATALLSLHGGHVRANSGFREAPDEAGTIAVKGGSVWYRVNGREHFSRGKVPLLVLHGGPGASHHYLLSLLELAAERPVIFYDQLDCGRSEHPKLEANWTIERFVSEIDAIRNALGLDRVALYGSSCGATWAAEYAMSQAPGLAGCILASPFLSADHWRADAERLRAALPQATLATLEQHEANGTTDEAAYHAADLEWIKRHVIRLDPWPADVARAFELFNGALYNFMWGPSESHLTGTLRDYDARSRLGQIQCPTLLTCGEHDEATPASTRAFGREIAHAQVEVFEGASHMPHIESAGRYLASAAKFLQQLDH